MLCFPHVFLSSFVAYDIIFVLTVLSILISTFLREDVRLTKDELYRSDVKLIDELYRSDFSIVPRQLCSPAPDDHETNIKVSSIVVHVLQNQRNCIVGRVANNSTVQRSTSSKYYVSWTTYSKVFYPSFCIGPAYLMTVDVIPKLFEGTLQRPSIETSDDALVTGIVAEEQDIQRTDVALFLRILENSSNSTYSASDQLRGHYAVSPVDPRMIRQIWTYDMKN
jgi:hypothetical protein